MSAEYSLSLTPSLVTTTMSSMRTPTRPGQNTDGSIVNVIPASSGVVLLADERVLVDVQPDAVAGAMAEPVAVPGVDDHLAARRVDLAGQRPRLDGGEAGGLGGDHRVVGALVLVARLADRHGAPEVGAVSVDDGAEVEGHPVTPLHPRARFAVGGVARAVDGPIAHTAVSKDAARAVAVEQAVELFDELTLDGAVGDVGGDDPMAESAMWQAAAIRSISVGDLIRRIGFVNDTPLTTLASLARRGR